MNFLNTLGAAGQDIVEAVGNNIEAGGQNALATAQYNTAVANYVNKKAAAESQKSAALAKALNTAAVGIIVILALVVVGKYFLPKLLK